VVMMRALKLVMLVKESLVELFLLSNTINFFCILFIMHNRIINNMSLNSLNNYMGTDNFNEPDTSYNPRFIGAEIHKSNYTPSYYHRYIPTTIVSPWLGAHMEKTYMNNTSQINKGLVQTYQDLNLKPIQYNDSYNDPYIENFLSIPEIPFNKPSDIEHTIRASPDIYSPELQSPSNHIFILFIFVFILLIIYLIFSQF